MKTKENTPASVELAAATDSEGGKDGSKADTEKYMARIHAAREWIRLNPDLWEEIETWALTEAGHQRMFAMQTVLERIRWKDYTDGAGQPTKVSNDFAAIWARMLVAKHPEIEPYVTMRLSVYDKLEVMQ